MRWFHPPTFVPIVLLFASLAVVQYSYFPQRQHETLFDALTQKAEAVAELAAYNVRPGLEFDDRELVLAVFEGAAQDPELLYIAAFREGEREPFAALNETDLDLSGLPQSTEATERTTFDDRVHVTTPITLGMGTATLVAGYSTRNVVMESQRNRDVALLIGGLLMIVGLGVALWIGRAVRRMERLAERAQAASKAKGEFLANMSHELRTPMNGVIGMTGLLANTSLNDRQRRFVDAIQSSSDTLVHIISDILDFSKIEAGQLSLELGPFDPARQIAEIGETLAPSAQSKNVELILDVSPSLPRMVRGDALRVRQVLTNLVANAIKFTHEGHVLIRARPEGDADAERVRVRIEVEDTGIGITEEAQKRLFAPFSQADTSTTRKYGGTGLGLVICRQLTEMMGGSMGLESEPGVGSTFHFSLPFEVVSAEEPPQPSQASLEGLRALIVDDHGTNRDILAAQVGDFGMESRLADNGRVALEMLDAASEEGERFDLVLLDFHMPEMDGLALAHAIRERPGGAELPLILLTSVTEDPQRARELRIAARLNKPVSRERLRQSIEMAVTGGEHGDAPAPGGEATERAGSDAPRVLVAEDNSVNQDVLIGYLELLGVRADVVDDGAKAVAALKAPNEYRLVFMDCQMPEMDGYQATREIRRREEQVGEARIPIVAVTAHAMRGDREKVIAAGMDDYLTKPVDQEGLEAMLRRWANLTPAPEREEKEETKPAEPTDDAELDMKVIGQLMRLQTPRRPRFYLDLVEKYAEDADRKVEELRGALESDAFETVRTTAHGLKGASRHVGACRVAELCVSLERAAESEDRARIESLVEELGESVARAVPRLTSISARDMAAPP